MRLLLILTLLSYAPTVCSLECSMLKKFYKDEQCCVSPPDKLVSRTNEFCLNEMRDDRYALGAFAVDEANELYVRFPDTQYEFAREDPTQFPLTRPDDTIVAYPVGYELYEEQVQEMIAINQQSYSNFFQGKTSLEKLFDWGWLRGAPIRLNGVIFAFVQPDPSAFGGYYRPDGSLIGPSVGTFLLQADVDEMANQTLARFAALMDQPLTMAGATQQLVDWGWIKMVVDGTAVLPFARTQPLSTMPSDPVKLANGCDVRFDVRASVTGDIALLFSACGGSDMTIEYSLKSDPIEEKVIKQIQMASSSVQRNVNNDNTQSLLYKEYLENANVPHYLELDKEMPIIESSGDPQNFWNSNTYSRTSDGEYVYVAVRDTPSFLGSSTMAYASGVYKIDAKTLTVLDSFHGLTVDNHRVLCQARYAPVVTDKYVFVTHWNTRDPKGALLYRLPVDDFSRADYVDMTSMLNLHDGRSGDWLNGPLGSITLEDEPIDGCGTRVYVGTSNFNYFGGFAQASLDRSVGLPQSVNAAAKVGCVCSDTLEPCISLEYSDGESRSYWQQGAPYANEGWVSSKCPFQGSWTLLDHSVGAQAIDNLRCHSVPNATETQTVLWNGTSTPIETTMASGNVLVIRRTIPPDHNITVCHTLTHEPGSPDLQLATVDCASLERQSTPLTLVRTAFVEEFHVNADRSKYAGAVEQFTCADVQTPIKVSELIPVTFDVAVTGTGDLYEKAVLSGVNHMDETVKLRVLKNDCIKDLTTGHRFVENSAGILSEASDPSSVMHYARFAYLTEEQVGELVDLNERQRSDHFEDGQNSLNNLVATGVLDPLSNYRFIASYEVATTYKVLRNESDPESYIYYPTFYDLSIGQLAEMVELSGFTVDQFTGWGWIERFYGYRWIAPSTYKDAFAEYREDGTQIWYEHGHLLSRFELIEFLEAYAESYGASLEQLVDWSWIQRATNNRGPSLITEGDVCKVTMEYFAAHWNTPSDTQTVHTKEGGSFVVHTHSESVETSITFVISRLEALTEEGPVLDVALHTMPFTSFDQTASVKDWSMKGGLVSDICATYDRNAFVVTHDLIGLPNVAAYDVGLDLSGFFLHNKNLVGKRMTWNGFNTLFTSGGGVWTPFGVDQSTETVFVPTGNAHLHSFDRFFATKHVVEAQREQRIGELNVLQNNPTLADLQVAIDKKKEIVELYAESVKLFSDLDKAFSEDSVFSFDAKTFTKKWVTSIEGADQWNVNDIGSSAEIQLALAFDSYMDIDCNLAVPKNGRVFANSKGGTLMILDQLSGQVLQVHRYAPGTSVGTIASGNYGGSCVTDDEIVIVQGTTISELADFVDTFPGWIGSDGVPISGNRAIIMAYDAKSQKQLWLRQQYNNLAGGITCVGHSVMAQCPDRLSGCVYNTKTGQVDQYIEGFYFQGGRESVLSGVSDGIGTLYFYNGGSKMQRFKITQGTYVPPPVPLVQNWKFASFKIANLAYDETKFTVIFTCDGFTEETVDADVQPRVWMWFGVENTPDDEYDCSGFSGCATDDCPACDQNYFDSWNNRPYMTSVVVEGVKFYKFELLNPKIGTSFLITFVDSAGNLQQSPDVRTSAPFLDKYVQKNPYELLSSVEDVRQAFVPYISNAAFLASVDPCACSSPETGCMILSDTGDAVDVTRRCGSCVVITQRPFCYVIDGTKCGAANVLQSQWADGGYYNDDTRDTCYSSYEETPDQSANCDGKVLVIETRDYYDGGDGWQNDNVIVTIGDTETTLFGPYESEDGPYESNPSSRTYKMCVPDDACLKISYEFGIVEEVGFRATLIGNESSNVLVDYYEQLALLDYLSNIYTEEDVDEGGIFMRHVFYNSCSRMSAFKALMAETKTAPKPKKNKKRTQTY